MYTGMGRGSDHVFLLRCESFNCVSVTAYIVLAPRGPRILNSGSDSSVLVLIMQVEKESTEVRGGPSHQRTFLISRGPSVFLKLTQPVGARTRPALEPGAATGQGAPSPDSVFSRKQSGRVPSCIQEYTSHRSFCHPAGFPGQPTVFMLLSYPLYRELWPKVIEHMGVDLWVFFSSHTAQG